MRQPPQRVNGTGVPAGSSPERPPGFQKLPGGFSLSGGLVERDKFGTKAADTPPAERGADDAPSGRWRLTLACVVAFVAAAMTFS